MWPNDRDCYSLGLSLSLLICYWIIAACIASEESSCMHGYIWLLFKIFIETGVVPRGARVRWAIIKWILHGWFRWRMTEQLWSATHHWCLLELKLSPLSSVALPFLCLLPTDAVAFQEVVPSWAFTILVMKVSMSFSILLAFVGRFYDFFACSLTSSIFLDSSLLLWSASALITCSGSLVFPSCDVKAKEHQNLQLILSLHCQTPLPSYR